MAMNQRHKPALLTPAVRTRVRQESKALSISETEYLALISQWAEAIRRSVLPDGINDPAMLHSLSNNPLFLQMIAALAGSIWSSMRSGMSHDHSDPIADTAGTDRAPEPELPQPPAAPSSPPGFIVIDPMTGQRVRILPPYM